jgi:hypothetical protein
MSLGIRVALPRPNKRRTSYPFHMKLETEHNSKTFSFLSLGIKREDKVQVSRLKISLPLVC